MALGSFVFDKEDRLATTLLHIAAEAKSIPCMRVLLRNGFDINARDVDKSTPLDEFATSGYIEGIDFLLYEGADATLKSSSDGTVLHTACAESTKAVVARFVESNMSLDAQDKDGFTPLFWTLDNFDKKEGIASAHYLVQMGADVTIKDRKGGALLTWALSKPLEQYDEAFCVARDTFAPAEEMKTAFADCADRLQMLEYMLTLEDIDLDAEASWMRGSVPRVGTIWDLAIDYLEDENIERAKLIKEGKAQWKLAARQAASKEETAKRKAEQKGKIKGWALEPLTGSSEVVVAAVDDTAMDTSVDVVPETTANDAAVGEKRPAEATAVEELESTRKRSRRHIASAAASYNENILAATAADQDMEDALAAASLQIIEFGHVMNNGERPGTSEVNGKIFITSSEHFTTQLKVHEGLCDVCHKLYEDETIPEACLRLLFMEKLRRACNDLDWGDAGKVQELLEVRKKYPCLQRRLTYHQHSALPPRCGPLHIASSYEDEGSHDLKILKLLLRAGIEDVTCNAEGLNGLQLVCEVGDIEAVEQFLKARADPNSIGKQPDEYTPLMLCCDSLDNGAAIAEKLLRAGAHLTTRDKFQNTAFHWAVYKGNIGVLEVLMDHAKMLGLTGRAPSSRQKKRASSSKIQIEEVIEATEDVIRLRRAAVEPILLDAALPAPSSVQCAPAGLSDPSSIDDSATASSCSSVNPFFSTNHWGNTIMHYACYKGFRTEGHFDCLRALIRVGIPYDQPKNLSGLVPRQVVAGFNAKHGRGKRVLVLLNSGGRKLIPEPKGEEIDRIKKDVARLEALIHCVLRRAPTEAELAQLDRSELYKLRKEYRPKEEVMIKLIEESRVELLAKLSRLPNNLCHRDWAPENGGAVIEKPDQPYSEADISRGREWTPIRLENDVDKLGGINYRYITHCLPHPELVFPLPLASGAADLPTAISQPKLNAQQQVEHQKFLAKKTSLQTKADQKQASMKRKVSAKTKEGVAKGKNAAGTAATTSTSSAAANAFNKKPAEVEPNPRCSCTGPNACLDASCPCFRQYTRKVVGEGPSKEEKGKSAADAVAKMGRLATKIEQLCNCHELCGCRLDCSNRHIARGIRVKLAVVKTTHKGWACHADEFIPRGTFICEYVGEIVPPRVAEERLYQYDKEGIHYVFGFQESDVCIDPVSFGNVARTINHSCSPNLTKIQIYGSCMRSGKRFPKMAFFAAKDIPKDEELAISYDYEEQEHPGGCLVCYCESENCRHTLV